MFSSLTRTSRKLAWPRRVSKVMHSFKTKTEKFLSPTHQPSQVVRATASLPSKLLLCPWCNTQVFHLSAKRWSQLRPHHLRAAVTRYSQCVARTMLQSKSPRGFSHPMSPAIVVLVLHVNWLTEPTYWSCKHDQDTILTNQHHGLD